MNAYIIFLIFSFHSNYFRYFLQRDDLSEDFVKSSKVKQNTSQAFSSLAFRKSQRLQQNNETRAVRDCSLKRYEIFVQLVRETVSLIARRIDLSKGQWRVLIARSFTPIRIFVLRDEIMRMLPTYVYFKERFAESQISIFETFEKRKFSFQARKDNVEWG